MSAYRAPPPFAKAARRASLWRRVRAWWQGATLRKLDMRRAGWCVRCRVVVERWPTFGTAVHVDNCSCPRIVGEARRLTLAGAFDAMAQSFDASMVPPRPVDTDRGPKPGPGKVVQS